MLIWVNYQTNMSCVRQMSSPEHFCITVILYLTIIMVNILNTFEALMKCQDNLTIYFACFINLFS